MAGSGGAAGVLLGGILTDGLGWEWVLWINVPVALIALAFTPRLIPESRSTRSDRALRRGRRRHGDRRADGPGLRAGRRDRRRLGLDPDARPARRLGRAARRFVAIEQRSESPLVPFRIFSNRTLTGANVVGLMVGASLFSMFFFISLYMQQVLDYSAIKAGLRYLPLAVTIILAAGIGSQLVTKIGFKPVLAAGCVSIAIGLVWFSQVSVGGSFLTTCSGPRCSRPSGSGFGFVTSTIAAVSGVEEKESGLASGLINTSQQIGGAIGLAVLATVANSKTEDMFDAGADQASSRALERGLPDRLPRRRRFRGDRPDPDAGADPQRGQPRPRGAGRGRSRPDCLAAPADQPALKLGPSPTI